MGYRSTVAYTIRFIPPQKDEPEKGLTAQNCRATFFTFLAEAKANGDTAGAIADSEYLTIDEKELTLNFFADDVKWYESYPDVQKVMEVFRFIDDEVESSWQYEFVRLGEDDNDVEVRSSDDPQWYLQVIRSVELHF